MLASHAFLHLAALIPATTGFASGFSSLVSRRRLSELRLFGLRESDSIMHFSSLGKLRCVCGAKHTKDGVPDRRQFCRSCGCEVVVQDAAALERHLTQREIKAMTRSLQRAAIRVSHLELPKSISCIEELQQYLDSPEPKTPRTPPTQSTPVEHPQVH